jgi:hypothetical protein
MADQVLEQLRLMRDEMGAVRSEGQERALVAARFHGETIAAISGLERRAGEVERSVDSLVPRVAVLEREQQRKQTPPGGMTRMQQPSSPEAEATGALTKIALDASERGLVEAEQQLAVEKLKATRLKLMAPLAVALATIAASTLTAYCAHPAAGAPKLYPVPVVVSAQPAH